MVERELFKNSLTKSTVQRNSFSLDLSVEKADSFIARFGSPKLVKHSDDKARELYHALGRNSLIKILNHSAPSQPAVDTQGQKEIRRKSSIGLITKNRGDELMPVVNVSVRKIEVLAGQKPASREQLGVVYSNGSFYMFGGASQQSYNDLRKLDPSRFEWTQLSEPTSTAISQSGPEARFGHSLNVFKDFLVIFGGAGLYNQEIKKRHTFDDLQLYDLNDHLWIDPIKDRDNSRLKPLAISLNNT